MMFLDEVVIQVKSGRGGNGCESHIRRPDRKMVPDGGDGGSGGDVALIADEQTGSLFPLHTKRMFEAEAGGFGKGNNRHGQNGKLLLVKVPCGTVVYDQTNGLLVRDLIRPGDQVIAVKGGHGGYGNHRGRSITQGEEGKSMELRLSLNILADVFLLGLPNSGKTTLLKILTGAHVEPAGYPFATKAPCLGTLQSEEERFRFCELPSVYRYSSIGRGLGVGFLKHLSRARLIFLVLDPLNPFARGWKDGYDILIRAIQDFNPELLKARRFVVMNKLDLEGAKKAFGKKHVRVSDPVFQISASSGVGLAKLVRETLKVLRRFTPEREQNEGV